MGGFHYWVDADRKVHAVSIRAVQCNCGHSRADHHPDGGICRVCPACWYWTPEGEEDTDDHARDQVGVDPTGPATTDDKGGDAHDRIPLRAELGSRASGTHVTGGPAAPPSVAAGPPELDHAIQAALMPPDRAAAILRHMAKWPDAPDGPYDLLALQTGADALEELQATRDRLADLEETARNVLSCLHAGNVFTAESVLRHALDGPAAQEEDRGG